MSWPHEFTRFWLLSITAILHCVLYVRCTSTQYRISRKCTYAEYAAIMRGELWGSSRTPSRYKRLQYAKKDARAGCARGVGGGPFQILLKPFRFWLEPGSWIVDNGCEKKEGPCSGLLAA